MADGLAMVEDVATGLAVVNSDQAVVGDVVTGLAVVKDGLAVVGDEVTGVVVVRDDLLEGIAIVLGAILAEVLTEDCLFGCSLMSAAVRVPEEELVR